MQLCREAVIDELLLSGWKHYERFPRWDVYSRRNKDNYNYRYGLGLDFVTVFKNGRTARGYYNV
jgi:hypothetical protein